MIDIREIIRQLRNGRSHRQIGASVGVDHKTVGRYHRWAKAQGWLVPESALPEPETLQQAWDTTWGKLPAQNVTPLARYDAEIRALRQRGLSKQVVMRELGKHGEFDSSYSALCRHIRQLEGPGHEATVRVETSPGEETQVDFGAAGLMYDPATKRVRKAWAFVMTLSWSRHQYVQFVFDQRVETWLTLHRQAFEAFGGVPRRIKLDNLKAAIVKACLDDPQVQRAYRECAEHYGFVIAPCRVATPRHKGKVERGVGYVAGNFLAGRDYAQAHENVQHANAEVRDWVRDVAGQRIHGTTRERPLQRFHETERANLQALPVRAYEAALWTTLQLHRDGYIVFEQSYYSAPFRLIGERLTVRATATTVQLYDPRHALVATHTRATQPGQRKTNAAHLPLGKAAGVRLETLTSLTPLQERAALLGPHVAQVIAALLEDRVVDKRRTVSRLLRLADQHSPAALEQACQRAVESGDPSPLSVRNWLKIAQSPPAAHLLQPGGEREWVTPPYAVTNTPVFARPAEELLPAIAFTYLSSDTPGLPFSSTAAAQGAEGTPCR